MALKTILGHAILWCDKNDPFDIKKISDIRNNNMNYWGEIKEITPPVEYFSDGQPTEGCKWWEIKIITDESEKQVTPPQLISGRMELSRVLDSTPEYVSFRWKR